MNRRSLLATALLLGACTSADTHQPLTSPVAACAINPADPPLFTRDQIAAAVEPIAEQAIREQKVVGLSVGVAHRGQPVYVEGFGLADLENGRPATGDTEYDLASIGKMFTAVSLLVLAEQGLLDLDDPVSRHLPGYGGPMRHATIRQLLSHTAGFVDGPDDLYLEPGKPEFMRPHRASEVLDMRIITEAQSFADLGTSFRYINASFDLLGVVVETLANRPYADFVHEHILAPAGMTSTTVSDWPHGPDATRQYRWDDGEVGPASYGHPSIFFGVSASVRDMLAFQCALDDGRLLTPASLAMMREPASITVGAETVAVPYGLATMMGPFEARRKLGHQGTWFGGSAHFVHFPDDDVTLVVLTNTNWGGTVQARELGSRIAHNLFGDMAPGYSRTPLPIDEEFARIVTGNYQWNGFANETRWEDGELRVRDATTGEVTGRLLRIGPLATTYIPADLPLEAELPAYRVSNPPYELGLLSPNGDQIFWFRDGGMFWDIGTRVPAEYGDRPGAAASGAH